VAFIRSCCRNLIKGRRKSRRNPVTGRFFH
jgi:hypothetical protein